MLKRFAARLVTSPAAFFVSWLIDLTLLLAQLRRQRAREREQRQPWISSVRR